MYYRDSSGTLRSSELLGSEVREQRQPQPHRVLCPLPDLEHALRQVGNHLRTPCRHKFPDGKTAYRRRSFQVNGHPAESSRCALCRIVIMIYFEEGE
jgi:hypothetical protein